MWHGIYKYYHIKQISVFYSLSFLWQDKVDIEENKNIYVTAMCLFIKNIYIKKCFLDLIFQKQSNEIIKMIK